MQTSSNSQFKSRFGFIAAAIGMAVGTGNMWRFPRVAAANGGGAFLVALTIAMFVYAIPLLLAEMSIARKTRLGTVGAMRDFMGRKFTWIGGWLALVAMGVMFYYSVVAGWTLKYLVLSVQGTFAQPDITPELTQSIWEGFLSSPIQTIFFHGLSMFFGAIVIYKGVSAGIEKVTKIMVPTLFVLITLVAIRGVTLPGASAGLEFLFTPNLEYLLKSQTWLEAFTQAAWSTGAGWALIMTYAVYTKEKEDLSLNCFIVGFGDVLVGLIASTAILPTVYSLSPTIEVAEAAMASGNNGLIFVYLSALFGNMPGGTLIAIVFFAALAFAALSSLLSMIEVGVLNLQDAGWNRGKATLFVCVSGFIIGIPSAYSIHFLDNQDFVWGVGLLISGLLISIAVMKYGVEKVRCEDINHADSDMYVGKWWSFMIRIFPLVFVVIFGWWTWQAIGWYPGEWWKPFEVFSPGTMAFQWGIGALIMIWLNDWLADRIKPGKILSSEQNDKVKISNKKFSEGGIK
ncbi:MAG: sodium-dependent transporter [Tindallia sp. MSAO_Bac2]|nr:MAG: sodium-dependent transporter [Tindallia sp. MSAO_Bac2]